MKCSICDCEEFNPPHNILPQDLIDTWELNSEETEYITIQQTKCCAGCGANIRSIVLAKAIKEHIQTDSNVLELNGAGNLTAYLSSFNNYTLGMYPDVDMHNLPYSDNTFDIIAHSDTLEHVEYPIKALQECHRVLKPGGVVCYTVPTVVGRMSRSREGLPPSYHGDIYLVNHEFGADMWTYPVKAGFDTVTIHTFDYPSGIAIAARK
jgi:SAM-dependent methyltransferase